MEIYYYYYYYKKKVIERDLSLSIIPYWQGPYLFLKRGRWERMGRRKEWVGGGKGNFP
jgi:hypothetical protein